MKYAVDWCNLNILLQRAQYQYLIRHFISFICLEFNTFKVNIHRCVMSTS